MRSMHRSRWSLAFIGWFTGAIIFGVLVYVRHKSRFLPAYVVVACNYFDCRETASSKIEIPVAGAWRCSQPSRLRTARIEDWFSVCEGDHKISWQPTAMNHSAGSVALSEQGLSGWDPSFANEPMSFTKKQEAIKAVASAFTHLQLVEAGKIRPKIEQR